MSYSFHIDPGHGWLAVRHDDLAALGLSAVDFTACSHIDERNIYLEEDCDAGKFIDAYKAKHGRAPDILERHSNSDSFIRRRPRNFRGKWQPFAR